MKTVIGTLLLTFVILFNSIQLSDQSDSHELPDFETFENIPLDRNVRLSNGQVYRSLGSGVINVQYNSLTGEAFVRQGVHFSRIQRRLMPSAENFAYVTPGNRITLANGYVYTSQGTEPIRVQYNVNGVANVQQGDKFTVLGHNYRLANYNYQRSSGRTK